MKRLYTGLFKVLPKVSPRILPILALGLSITGAAADPNYPNRAVSLIVPFPPGGPTDVMMRVVGEALSQHWKQPVVIHNRPGGATVVGTNAVKQAPADGYTIGAAVGPFATNPAVRSKLPYDTLKDFTPVSMIAEEFVVLAAHKSVPADTVEELVALAKKSEKPLSYATPSIGGSAHLAAEMLKVRAGIEMMQVPYTGSAKALVDFVAGRVDLMFGIWHSMKPYVDAGDLKIIAVVHQDRLKDAPQYATLAETYPGLAFTGFEGLFVRSETPAEIVDKIVEAVRVIIKEGPVADKLRKAGAEPLGSGPKEFRAYLEGQIGFWSGVAKEAKIKLD